MKSWHNTCTCTIISNDMQLGKVELVLLKELRDPWKIGPWHGIPCNPSISSNLENILKILLYKHTSRTKKVQIRKIQNCLRRQWASLGICHMISKKNDVAASNSRWLDSRRFYHRAQTQKFQCFTKIKRELTEFSTTTWKTFATGINLKLESKKTSWLCLCTQGW